MSYFGLLQPVLDGIKLLFKDWFFVKRSQSALFIISPILLMLVFMVLWVLILPWWGSISLTKLTFFGLFISLGIGAYAAIITGWRSQSAFSKLGSLRGILQSLSFEVALILVVIRAAVFIKTLSLFYIEIFQENLLLWGIIWFILSLIETNRAPFDLLEGERELIRGFNVEFGRTLFVYLFLREYGMIIFLILFITTPFSGLRRGAIVLVCLVLFIRRCFPRVRYDIMIRLIWIRILPVAICLFLFIVCL